MVTDHQVRKLMAQVNEGTPVGVAALRSGMNRKTARRYLKIGKLPSETSKPRSYRTRKDAFSEDWPQVKAMLTHAPELEAKTLFEYLCERTPERYEPGHLRTLQRRVREWRASEGPAKEVFFRQQHRPGEAAQTDFTWATELGITIDGELFEHMLCHLVLPYSNWDWATICRSESIAALRDGIQEALYRLGHHPEWHQTDNSTAATHQVKKGRSFNQEYQDIMDHLGMKPRTTGIGKKEQNGDIEAANGALKSRMKQHLLLRGHTNFDSVEDYERWLVSVLLKGNQRRLTKLEEELAVMPSLTAKRLPAFVKTRARVSTWSTIRIKHNSYSLPSRLINEEVDVYLYEDRLEVFYRGTLQLSTPRLLGRNRHQVDYRHIIWSLVKKPGAFPRYMYRSDLFPTLTFRRAYDALLEDLTPRKADISYLRILHLAASTLESEVELALECLLEAKLVPTSEEVKSLVVPRVPRVPTMTVLTPNIADYDALLTSAVAQ